MEVEQITKEPEKKAEQIKDPKKVMAGKRLAEKNREAKQALVDREKAVEERETVNTSGSVEKSGLIPQMNLTAAIGIASILLTAAGLYLQYGRSKSEPREIKPVKREPERQLQQKPAPNTMRIGME